MFEILILALAIGLLLKMRGMSTRMRHIEQQVKDLQARIDLGLIPATQPAPTPILTETSVKDGETAVAEAASETTVVAETPLPGDAMPQAASETAEAAAIDTSETIAPPAMPTKTVPEKAPESLESIIGARWAVWAGGLTLAMGGLFLVRYSIESGLLGPGVRLMLAALFGLALLGAGEAIRRRMLPGIALVHENAMVPGILTAAGTVSLFGSIYAAHGIYGFIGPATAFTLLALTSFATLGLSLLHGQALAGLGLLGSMVMPLLVASTAPSPWTLFIYLTITLAATQAASRFRGWQVVPVLANLGIGLWALLYLHFTPVVALTPPALALLAMIAIATYFWPGAALDTHDRETPAPLLLRQPLGIMLSLSFALVIPVLSIITVSPVLDADPVFVMAALLAAFAAIATVRHYMGWPALFAAAGAVIGSLITVLISADFDIDLRPGDFYPSVIAQPLPFNDTAMLLGLGALFLPLAFLAIRRKGEADPGFALLWSITGTVVPVVIGTICFIAYWADGIDWLHGLYGIAIALALLAAAEWVSRATAGGLLRHAIDVFVAGSFAAATLALHALTDGLFTTVLLAVLGFAYVFATRHRHWPALPWMMVAASACVFVRIAYDPTLVGALNLGRTPVFNQLLPGYGIPAALAMASAWLLGRWPEARVRNAMQAIAAVMGLLAVAVLLRHVMTGGMLEGPTPTLGEQSIYSLLLIGFSGILMALDFRSPSPVFRLGTMIAGGLSMLNILTLHIGALNPYFTGEDTGSLPLVNLLLLGYLMPALAYAGLALYARGRRPQPYVAALAIGAALLGFAWATLSVRRFWQGDNIAAWKGFMQGETYSYSVVWLAIGVGLLALGSRLDARSLRLASAVLVVIAVAKAFLIDMSNLEGVLRALSFIGLGIVLIGIGLFYQKILSRPRAAREPAAEPAPPPA